MTILKKQIALLIATFLLFVSVWGLVIFQVIGKQSEAIPEIPVEESYLDEVVLNDGEEAKDNVTDETAELENITNDEDLTDRTETYINLADYDFSDISSPDGVPVDGILEKIGLAD